GTGAQLGLVAAAAGLPRRHRDMAGAAVPGPAAGSRPATAGLCPGTAVQADRHPLCQRLASPPAVLVLPAGDGDDVAAGQPAAAVAGAGLVAPLPSWRSTLCPAAGLGTAGASVLQRQPRQ